MTTNTIHKAHYRRLADGTWAVFGPAAEVVAGTTINVTKKDGTVKAERIERVGKETVVDGRLFRFGFIATKAATRPVARANGTCPECGERAARGTRCWETGLAH